MNGGVRMRHRRGQRQRGAGQIDHDLTTAHERVTRRPAAVNDDNERDELRMLEDEEQRLVDRLDAVSDAIEGLKKDAKEVKNNATRR